MSALEDHYAARRAVTEAFATDPFVGLGATYSILNDSHPFTVSAVLDARTILVDSPTLGTRTLTLRRTGAWVQQGEPAGQKQVGRWTLGVAETHRGEDWR